MSEKTARYKTKKKAGAAPVEKAEENPLPKLSAVDEWKCLVLNLEKAEEEKKAAAERFNVRIKNIKDQLIAKAHERTDQLDLPFDGDDKKKLSPGYTILEKEKFPTDIGGGLKKTISCNADGSTMWAVAYARKRRLSKEESEQFRLKLEELTVLKWKHDKISKFVFHYNSEGSAE